MQHRGEILRKAMKETKYGAQKLADKLHRSRGYIYNLYDRPDINPEILLLIGKIIDYDFTAEIDFFKTIKDPDHIGYGNKDEEIEYWKNRYLELLKEYKEALDDDTKE